MTTDTTENGMEHDQDVESRLQMWKYSTNLIVQSPFIGSGFQSFKFDRGITHTINICTFSQN